MIDTIKNLEKYNNEKIKIGLDSSLENFALINGKITLIDLYPAFIKNEFSINTAETTEQIRPANLKLFSKLFPKISIKIAQRRIDNRFNLINRKNRLFENFLELRPSLRIELINLLNN